MANRKVTPLKDEPGTSLEDIQVELSNCIQAINTLSGKIDTLAKPTANDTSSLKDAVGKAAANEVKLPSATAEEAPPVRNAARYFRIQPPITQ